MLKKNKIKKRRKTTSPWLKENKGKTNSKYQYNYDENEQCLATAF